MQSQDNQQATPVGDTNLPEPFYRDGTPGGLPPTPPRRLALVVEYDGSNYVGFQLQSEQPTIQGEIERGLAKFTGEPVRIRGASRTDSGAHALGQVVDFPTHSTHPVESFPKALNYYLPDDIEVQTAWEVSLEFHSRRDAVSRTYRYHILNRPWPSPLRRNTHYWVRNELQVSLMASAAQGLVGGHDFRWFAVGFPAEKSALRRVYRWEVWQEGDTVIIECEANGFLRHQIRRANALLIEIGRGRFPESTLKDALEGTLLHPLDCPQAPAHGLCLIKVTYRTPLRPAAAAGRSSSPVMSGAGPGL
jgi:tRNA pseudouridine38-40 synthase